MVDEPVMANTVESNIISRYHWKVLRGGISFGPRKFCINVLFCVVVVDGGGGDDGGDCLVLALLVLFHLL